MRPSASSQDLLVPYQAPDKEWYVLRLRCDGYDEEPPSFQFVNPADIEETGDKWWPRLSRQSIARLNDRTPVFCAYGIREYHRHDSHRNETRDKTRWTLPQVVTRAWEFFTKAGEYQGRGI